MREQEAASVPELVREITTNFELFAGVDDGAVFLLFLLHRETNVLVVGAEACHHETESVRAVLLFDIHRIDTIALGLAHGHAIAVQNLRVDVHRVERNRAHVFLAEEHHAGDPERNDVAARHEHRSRIVLLKRVRLFRPAHRGVRPETTGEPRVEHVFFLHNLVTGNSIFLQVFFFGADEPDAVLCLVIVNVVTACECLVQVLFGRRFVGVPNRNAVAPPELTADAPVALFLEPVEVLVGVAFRNDLDFAARDSLHRVVGEDVHLHEPLVAQVRFNHSLGTVGMAHLHFVVFDLDEEAQVFETLHHGVACSLTLHALERTGVFVEAAVVVHDVDHRELVAEARSVVVRVMSRSHLHGTRTEFHIDEDGVCNHRNFAVHERNLEHLADELLVAFVVGVHGECRIAHDRFRTSRRNRDKARTIGERILERPEVTLHSFVINFIVCHSRLELGVPVHETLATVDKTLLEKVEECVADSLCANRVEREALTAPVAADAEAFELLRDAGFVFVLPLPNAFHEGVAANVVACLVFVLEKSLFDDSLRGNAGVVRARNPERVATSLTAIADENVLQRVVQSVAEVQSTRNVRRRNDDGERFTLSARGEIIILVPLVVPTVFYNFRIITSFHFHNAPNLVNSVQGE